MSRHTRTHTDAVTHDGIDGGVTFVGGLHREHKEEVTYEGVGGTLTIEKTYVDRADFSGIWIEHRELVGIRISGDISEQEANEIYAWIRGRCCGPTPVCFERFTGERA